MNVTAENWRDVVAAQKAARRETRQTLQYAATMISYDCWKFLVEEFAENPGPMLAALTVAVAVDILQELEDEAGEDG